MVIQLFGSRHRVLGDLHELGNRRIHRPARSVLHCRGCIGYFLEAAARNHATACELGQRGSRIADRAIGSTDLLRQVGQLPGAGSGIVAGQDQGFVVGVRFLAALVVAVNQNANGGSCRKHPSY